MISYDLIWGKASSYEACLPHMRLFCSYKRYDIIWAHMRLEGFLWVSDCHHSPLEFQDGSFFSLGLCCLPLWQSSLVLRLLYIFWNPFCRAHILEKEIWSPFAGPILWELFCRTLFSDLEALLQGLLSILRCLGLIFSCPCAFSCGQCAIQHHLHQALG